MYTLLPRALPSQSRSRPNPSRHLPPPVRESRAEREVQGVEGQRLRELTLDPV